MIFYQIKNFEGRYEISEDGSSVRSIQRMVVRGLGGMMARAGKIMTISKERGYLKVMLCDNGKRGIYALHRLMAETFIPNPEHKPCVNHINGIKADNRKDNLEWCTQSENILHAYRTGLKKPSRNNGSKGEKNGGYKRKWDCYHKKVIDIRTGKEYKSLKEASISIGMAYAHLSLCLNNKRINYTSLKYA